MAGAAAMAVNVWLSSGAPAQSSHCLGVEPPNRTPRPAATRPIEVEAKQILRFDFKLELKNDGDAWFWLTGPEGSKAFLDDAMRSGRQDSPSAAD